MGGVYGPEGLDAYLATRCVFLPAAPALASILASAGRAALR